MSHLSKTDLKIILREYNKSEPNRPIQSYYSYERLNFDVPSHIRVELSKGRFFIMDISHFAETSVKLFDLVIACPREVICVKKKKGVCDDCTIHFTTKGFMNYENKKVPICHACYKRFKKVVKYKSSTEKGLDTIYYYYEYYRTTVTFLSKCGNGFTYVLNRVQRFCEILTIQPSWNITKEENRNSLLWNTSTRDKNFAWNRSMDKNVICKGCKSSLCIYELINSENCCMSFCRDCFILYMRKIYHKKRHVLPYFSFALSNRLTDDLKFYILQKIAICLCLNNS